MVGGDIVLYLKDTFTLNSAGKRLAYGNGLYVGTAEYFHLFALFGRIRRNKHIIVYAEYFGHFYLGHIAKGTGIGYISRNCGSCRNTGR